MAEITPEYINGKRAYYQGQLALLQGAIAALDEIERDLFGSLTLDELKDATGAQSVEIVPNESEPGAVS